MTIRDFIELACDDSMEEVIICNCSGDNSTNIFEGSCYDALHDYDNEELKEALDTEISSWDMEDGKICLNYFID